MEAQVNSAEVNKCANCGGDLIYNAGTYTNKCEYCGSEFKLKVDEGQKKGSALFQTNFVPFKISREQFSKDLMKWLINNENAPADILSKSVHGVIKQCYVPVYYFKGTYVADWYSYKKTGVNKAPDEKRKKLEGGQLIENYELYALGTSSYKVVNQRTVNSNPAAAHVQAKSDVSHPIVQFMANYSLNVTEALPADSNIFQSFNVRQHDLSPEQSWEKYGKVIAYNQLYKKLDQHTQNDSSKDFSITDINYQTKSAVKIYVPVWMVTNTYTDYEYTICMDGVTGSLAGDVFTYPELINPPKFRYYIGVVTITVILLMLPGIGLSIIKGKNFNPNDYNNFFISPLYSFWWWLNMLLAYVIIPVFAVKYLRERWRHKNDQRLQTGRQIEYEDFLSGKLTLTYCK